MNRPFEKLLRETREDLGTREAAAVDWPSVDRALFARIGESRANRPSRTRRALRPWGIAAAAALGAAGVAIAVENASTPASAPNEAARNVEPSEDAVSIEDEARVNGVTVSRGTRLRLGDVVETLREPVALERAGKVTVTLVGARVRVTQWREPLVFALEVGAVEARVTPVSHGEAFAVDIETARVAVHGTHLRVERLPSRKVLVDLTEGVIAIGEAPPAGPVVGAVVRAPAHAEFMAYSVLNTLTMESVDVTGSAPSSAGRPPASSLSAPPLGRPLHVTAAPPAPPTLPPSAPIPSVQGPLSPTGPVASDLADVVRGCMAARPHVENLTVLVNTTLFLTLNADGSVQSARFDPPVLTDVNACATRAIYRARFEHGGTIAIPIGFKN